MQKQLIRFGSTLCLLVFFISSQLHAMDFSETITDVSCRKSIAGIEEAIRQASLPKAEQALRKLAALIILESEFREPLLRASHEVESSWQPQTEEADKNVYADGNLLQIFPTAPHFHGVPPHINWFKMHGHTMGASLNAAAAALQGKGFDPEAVTAYGTRSPEEIATFAKTLIGWLEQNGKPIPKAVAERKFWNAMKTWGAGFLSVPVGLVTALIGCAAESEVVIGTGAAVSGSGMLAMLWAHVMGVWSFRYDDPADPNLLPFLKAIAEPTGCTPGRRIWWTVNNDREFGASKVGSIGYACDHEGNPSLVIVRRPADRK